MCGFVASCGADAQQTTTPQASNEPNAPITTTIDAGRMLSLESRITDAYVTAHGSCLTTGLRPERSRLLYLMLPEDTAYLRLNVVSSANGVTVEMIDFVRGLPSGAQWSATQRGAKDPVVTRTFASISDHAPLMGELAADGVDARRLRAVATNALGLHCPTP
jgi:hypothetical protein